MYDSLIKIKSQDGTNGALFQGVALATVTNISELNSGRVKVKFQWRNIKDEIWARIVTSKKDEQPDIEVYDIVLVAFEQGNFEYPFILGFVYPSLKDNNT